jgi:hypothetical protein
MNLEVLKLTLRQSIASAVVFGIIIGLFGMVFLRFMLDLFGVVYGKYSLVGMGLAIITIYILVDSQLSARLGELTTEQADKIAEIINRNEKKFGKKN